MQFASTPSKSFSSPDQKLLRSNTPDALFHIDISNGPGPHNNFNMLLCDLDGFFRSYGPCQITNVDVDRFFQEMLLDGLVKYEGGRYSWSGCEQGSSSELEMYSAALDPLRRIVDHALKSIWANKPKKTDIELIPLAKVQFADNITGSSHKADVLSIGAPYIDTHFMDMELNKIADVKERSVASREIIHLQILGACRHIMNEDARRMWIYGLTFEGDMCSLWYFSRTHSVKTVAFNWVTSPATFVRVLLVFSKATPNELGIDPTVHLGPKNLDGTTSFIYEVPATVNAERRFFRTVESVFPPHSMAIAGRTTRVWKVVEVSSSSGDSIINQKEVILKDVWLDEGIKTEAENMDAMFAAVDQFVDNALEALLQDNPTETRKSLLLSPDTMNCIIEREPRLKTLDQVSKDRLSLNLTNKAYRSLFLTKLHAWQGEVCKPIGDDVWRCPTLFSCYTIDYLESDERIRVAHRIASGAGHPQCTPENLTLHRVDQKERTNKEVQQSEEYYRHFVSRRQSRVIYDEVCTTLQDLDTLGEVVDVLSHTMDAMHILFVAGWVHRDISANNIMAYRPSPNEQWAAKLADLEFSRLMVDPAREHSADPRIGTPFFMPVEILDRKYLLDIYTKTESEMAQDHIPEFLRNLAGPPTSLATKLNASVLSPEFSNNLERFDEFPFVIPIPPNPCWDKIKDKGTPVNHNFQHDLESIWWILLWIILCRIKPEGAFQNPPRQVLRYFNHDISLFEPRMLLFTADFNNVAELFPPDIRTHFFRALDVLRFSMHKAYLGRGVFGHLEVPESYSDIQSQFAQVLQYLRGSPGSCKAMELKKRPPKPLVVKSSHAQADEAPEGTRKRGRDSSESSDSDSDEDKDEWDDDEYDDDEEDEEEEEEEEAHPMHPPNKRRRKHY